MSPSKNGSRSSGAAEYAIVSKEFDAVFYVLRYPDVVGDPVRQFMETGWREGRDPAPSFSTSFYLETHDDVRQAGTNPFLHFIQYGRAEGRLTQPAVPSANDRSWEIEAIRRGIDEPFYSKQLRDRGIDPDGLDATLHYWREGAVLGLDPAETFSTNYYLSTHEDVAAAGVNPFAHYLVNGESEGRTARPARVPIASGSDYERDLLKAGFDPDHYRAAYPDIAAAGVDPLTHFHTTGWKEGRNPNVWFSVPDYLEFYPDVAEAQINPFLHYLMAGKAEGRVPRHELGFRYDIIRSLTPLDERIAHARASAPPRKISRAKVLTDALQGATRLESTGLYLSISHDDFTENFGGVQLVLMRESAAVDEMGFDHLHLFPSLPLPVAELDDGDPVLGVLLNRKRVGFFRTSEIADAMTEIAHRIRERPFVIHSLIGHSSPALVSILHAAGCRKGWYWVHDYSSVCTGYTLMRNDVEFCGGPPADSGACQICVYGRSRTAQVTAHELLFDQLDLTVLAPSRSALDVWKASTGATVPAHVHEHMKLTAPAKRRGRNARVGPARRPLRVAYVGQAVSHKGWPVFRELTMRFAADTRYRFFHLGKGAHGAAAEFREIAVGPDDLDQMVKAIRDLEIDVAIVWSLWPETFCIAAVEALRGGAAILTYKDSGNVAAIVRETGFGEVLGSEDALYQLFETGEVIEVAASARPVGLGAEFSNMTADFIGGDVK